MKPYFCLYVGTNLVELYHAQTEATPYEDFCTTFYSGELELREILINSMYEGANCVETVSELGYQES